MPPVRLLSSAIGIRLPQPLSAGRIRLLPCFSGMNGQPLRAGCTRGNNFVLHTNMIGNPAQVPAEAPEPANPVGAGRWIMSPKSLTVPDSPWSYARAALPASSRGGWSSIRSQAARRLPPLSYFVFIPIRTVTSAGCRAIVTAGRRMPGSSREGRSSYANLPPWERRSW